MKLRLCLAIASVSALLGGCVGPGADFKKEKTDTQQPASYLNSTGITNSQKRMAENLAESVQKRREQVSWGGVAIFGNKAEGEDLPITSRLSADFQAALVEKLRAIHPGKFDLKNLGNGVADNLRSQDALVLVVALAAEYPSQHPDPNVAGKIRGEMTIRGHLLFLDSKSGMQVVASYPVGVTQRNIFDGEPSPAEFSTLAKTALMGSERFPNGKAASLSDQVADLLAGDTVVPRAIFPPVAVAPVSFGSGCGVANTPRGPVNISVETLARWSDEFAVTFGSYLGTGSGFPVNPYLPGGSRRIGSDRVLSAAGQITMRTVNNKQLNASLKAPTLTFKLEVASLRAVRDEKESIAKLRECVNYGISGKLLVVNADTGHLVQEVLLEWPSSPSQRLPAKLASEYLKRSVKIYPDNHSPVDHIGIWERKIDWFLGQLALEIAFPEEDLAHRFESLRSNIRHNAGITLPSGNYASLP